MKKTGAVLFCNKAYCSLIDCGYDEAIATTTDELAHPDYKATINEHWQKRKEGNKERLDYELAVITKKREQKWLSLSSIVIGYRGVERSLLYAKDISLEKEQKERLIRDKNNFEILFNDSNSICVVLDVHNFQIIKASAAALSFFRI